MKRIPLIAWLALLPFLSSCRVVSYYDYTHGPTASIKQALWDGAYKNAKCLKNEDLVIIPDFRAFSPSFPQPNSRLIVCSKSDDPFWIEKAILRIPGEGVETTLTLAKEFPYRQPIGDSGYYIVWILLFDDKNTDYSTYKMKENLELELHFAPSKDKPISVETFKLELIKRKDVAWPT